MSTTTVHTPATHTATTHADVALDQRTGLSLLTRLRAVLAVRNDRRALSSAMQRAGHSEYTDLVATSRRL